MESEDKDRADICERCLWREQCAGQLPAGGECPDFEWEDQQEGEAQRQRAYLHDLCDLQREYLDDCRSEEGLPPFPAGQGDI